jgi:hypothetical protein
VPAVDEPGVIPGEDGMKEVHGFLIELFGGFDGIFSAFSGRADIVEP